MAILNIQPAVREGSHLIVSFTGPSGSGKTLSAIKFARGLVGPDGKIGFLDTETGRAKHHARETPFDHAELTPPFSPARYIEAIKEFEDAKFPALVIDSASHEWEGIGGVLELKEQQTQSNDFAKWAFPKLQHKKFMNALLSTRMHVILCLRAREKLRQVENERTHKKEVVSDGWREIQEKNFIFEVTLSVLLMRDGYPAEITKCPGELRGAFPLDKQISVDTGAQVAAWLGGAVPVDHELDALMRAGREVADMGREQFVLWWNRPDVRQRRASLAAHLGNFQSIAAEADRRIAAEKLQRDSGDGGDLDAPFGSAPAGQATGNGGESAAA